jgi:hypothetical protein
MVSYRAGVYAELHGKALEMVRDPSLSLVFLHYSIPHLPGFYDRDRGAIDTQRFHTYLDNLALADRTIGELRRALEDAHLWDATTVLVHADHALRPQIWKSVGLWTGELEEATGGQQGALTPFALKLAHQREPVHYNHPFNAVLAHDLVLALVEGQVQDPEQALAWLDTNRHRRPLHWHVTTLADR